MDQGTTRACAKGAERTADGTQHDAELGASTPGSLFMLLHIQCVCLIHCSVLSVCSQMPDALAVGVWTFGF